MSVNWDDYNPYEPPYYGPLAELSRAEARESFNQLMSAKSERIDMLRALLKANGLPLSGDDDSVQRLAEWLRSEVEANPEHPERLRNIWYAVVNDVALFLGETLINRCPGLRWEMFTAGRRDVAYQKHVITGFRKVANPKYNLDIDRLVATYLHQVISGKPTDPSYFVNVLEAAAAKV
ncbi:hypothetical protein V6U89_18765 [Micromonospora sp. CPCC 206171]|uniref:hypothetical protein n=1 Tax=Micromonospora sp. CPCC 206171 TaxID=3122405 RepID=UPI002FEF7663